MLREVDAVRQRTRAVVHPAWFPMLLFGVFGLASAPFCAIGHGRGQALFWLVAGPVGGILTSRHHQRQAMATGAGMRGGPYWAVAAGIFVAAWLAGSADSSRIRSAGPMLAVALGYLVFARLERSWPVAVCSAFLGAVAVAVAVADVRHTCVVLSVTFGSLFVATGLLLRRADHG